MLIWKQKYGKETVGRMKIHKSAEDYLEMILRLNEEKGYVRSVDIATGLSVSKPSVSVAMKHLREDGSSPWTGTTTSR